MSYAPTPEVLLWPQPEHGTRPDILVRCGFLHIAYLRNPNATKRDEVCDKLAAVVDELSRLAALAPIHHTNTDNPIDFHYQPKKDTK